MQKQRSVPEEQVNRSPVRKGTGLDGRRLAVPRVSSLDR
jgi:hypothetical protein